MTTRETRIVRFGAGSVGLILLYLLVLDPYFVGRSERAALIEERESRLARLQALERSLPTYRQGLTAARRTWEIEVAPRLLAAEIPAVAASALSKEVRRIASQSFLEVERENPLPTADEDGLTSVPVQFSLRGDIYGLRDLLAALEASESFLHLRELRVATVTGGFAEVETGEAPLQITITVEGYLGGTGLAAAELDAAAGLQPEGGLEGAGGLQEDGLDGTSGLEGAAGGGAPEGDLNEGVGSETNAPAGAAGVDVGAPPSPRELERASAEAAEAEAEEAASDPGAQFDTRVPAGQPEMDARAAARARARARVIAGEDEVETLGQPPRLPPRSKTRPPPFTPRRDGTP